MEKNNLSTAPFFHTIPKNKRGYCVPGSLGYGVVKRKNSYDIMSALLVVRVHRGVFFISGKILPLD